MAITQTSAPSLEPITLAQAKAHLRVESVDFSTDVDSEQSIAPGSHDIAASYSLEGAAVDVLGYDAVVNLEAGTCGSSGTVDVKLQERDSESEAWGDVSSGAFTQVTEANDEATFEKAYTGTKRYVRAVATVAEAACEFAVVVVRRTAVCEEDDLITALIVAAREYAEGFQNRAYITQTWELWLDDWPSDCISIPRPPLQSTDFKIEYYDTDNTKHTWSSDDYSVDINHEPGRVFRNSGKSWPSESLRPRNAICVTYTAGYGDAATDVPQKIRQALLLLIAHYYENREAVVIGQGFTPTTVPMAVESLLWQDRIMEL